MRRDDAMDDGEAEASSLVDRLGGEEWLEDTQARGLVHAATRICHAQTDDRQAVRARQRLQGHGDDPNAVADRLRGVGDEIDDDLMELAVVSRHWRHVADRLLD